MTKKIKGYNLGALAAAFYGLNPLFAMPLMRDGMTTDSILFYRYFFAIILVGIGMRMRHISFALSSKDIIPFLVLGILYSCSSLFLFESYHFMSTNIASTLLFVYPILTAIIMSVFFHERLSIFTILAILLMLSGVAMLYRGDGSETLSGIGVLFVFLSSLSYAIYMVGVNKTHLSAVNPIKLTFYCLLFGISIYVIRLRGGVDLQLLSTSSEWFNALGLTIFPTFLSLLLLIKAVQYIGSTSTSILGALEPLTAVAIGVLFLDDMLTVRITLGIILILFAVMMNVMSSSLEHKIRMIHIHPKLHRKRLV